MYGEVLMWPLHFLLHRVLLFQQTIDYVYFKGKGVEVTDAKIVGEDKEHADIVVSPYPSDHRAVVATFTVAK